MYEGTAVLHFASDTDDRALAVGDCGSVEHLHQLWHQALAEHRPGLEQRSQILDELTGLRITAIPTARVIGQPQAPRTPFRGG
jgi:hypothetical protein